MSHGRASQNKIIYPPITTESGYSTRLTDRLNAGLDGKLTLISAPAGFGKTTLLSEWIPRSPRCVTWLSLDDSDNDPVSFWTYFIASLQQLGPKLGADVLPQLQSPQAPPINSIVTSLINDSTAFPDTFAIVLDDYHVIDSKPIHEALTFLIDHLPANMHLIITTRVDPLLPIARLRARDKLTELRANDLRFTTDEVAAFLTEAMRLNLSTEEIAALETRTEGWIAGLQIAALSMQGQDDVSGFVRAFSGSHRHILGYLADEVINRQSAGIQNFLLQISILGRLCGSLCDAVMDDSGGQAILEELEHANLFVIPLDNEGRWYRYHHLFAEVLRTRLQRTQPDILQNLHFRASIWYEEKGLWGETVAHALSASDFERVARLVEQTGMEAALQGQAPAVFNWLTALPETAVHANPKLCVIYAWLLLSFSDFENAEKQLEIAEKALESQLANGISFELQNIRGEILATKAMQAVYRRGFDPIQLISWAEQALQDPPS